MGSERANVMLRITKRMTPNKQSGFTLIEIIVALVIVAVAILAIGGSMNQNTQITSELEERLLASWVASNKLSEVRYKSNIDRIRTGTKTDVVKMGGHRWKARVKINETDSENVFLVKIQVENDKSRDNKPAASLTTVIAKF